MRSQLLKLIAPGMVGICLLTACHNNNNSDPLAGNGATVINRDSLKRQIKILSSDSFMGRRPFTIGEERTVTYIQSEFARMGLQPGNGDSYIQEVPMVDITVNAAPEMKVEGSKGSLALQNVTDYVVATERTDSILSLDKDELVFVGYGVVAPEYNWNDYAGIDVKGKVVLVLVNDPGFNNSDTTLFKGKAMTYYGRWTYKYEEAARQGAKACLIIHNTKAASYPFAVVQNSWGKSNLYIDSKGSSAYHCALQGWLTGDATKRVLAAAGKDTTLLATADKPGFKAVPLDVRLSTKVHVSTVYNKSKNVIAKITGTKYPDEYIIYTAHWDHLGVGKPDAKGDTIYNGAIDNASGSAALLEMARAFKAGIPAPERTIIFLSVTAEEQGLLGSAWYTQHPIYPLAKTVAELNMDGINAFEKTKDVAISGRGQNELEDHFIAAAKEQGRYLAPETKPEAGGYFRSDHFNFAKAGVPALNAGGGTDVVGKGKAYGEKLNDEYIEKHYHQPSDEYDDSWTFDGGIEDIKLLYNIGAHLAAEQSWPKWKDGSEFKAIREKK